jgi:hypothetical protein
VLACARAKLTSGSTQREKADLRLRFHVGCTAETWCGVAPLETTLCVGEAAATACKPSEDEPTRSISRCISQDRPWTYDALLMTSLPPLFAELGQWPVAPFLACSPLDALTIAVRRVSYLLLTDVRFVRVRTRFPEYCDDTRPRVRCCAMIVAVPLFA